MFLKVGYKRDGYTFTFHKTEGLPVESLKDFRDVNRFEDTWGWEYSMRDKTHTILDSGNPVAVVCTATGRASILGLWVGEDIKPIIENWLKNTNLTIEWIEPTQEERGDPYFWQFARHNGYL